MLMLCPCVFTCAVFALPRCQWTRLRGWRFPFLPGSHRYLPRSRHVLDRFHAAWWFTQK